ncbi:MAG: hypothetical protein ACE5OO_02570 [Candidatus Bathyarchaeia archaeon]
MLRFFGRRDDTRSSLKQMLASLNSLAVNLLRFSEMWGLSPASDEERKLRLEMSLSDLEDFRKLSDSVRGKLSPTELTRSVDIVRSFAVISAVEGTDFIESNLDRILRSARWAIANIEKASRG